MRQIRLIASDLDGTLLPFGVEEIPSEIFDLIRRLKSQGIRFFVASGRQYRQLTNLFAEVKNEIGFISENGCLAILDGEVISQEFMNMELGREIIQAILEKDSCEAIISSEEGYFLQPKREEFFEDQVKNSRTKVFRENLLEHSKPYMRISICQEPGFSEEDVAYWKNRFGSRCTVQTNGTPWMDLVPLGVNKASALKKIIERLGIDSESVVAFGDNENDREMLEFVGNPVAMKNSKVESLGKFVTEDVAKTLRKILDGEFE